MINIKQKTTGFRLAVWINLWFGLYNLYFFTQSDHLFNLIIGSINIGVWVFNRKYLW